MDELQFAIPVRVKLSDGQPVEEVYGVDQALEILSEWPSGRQGPLYQAAFNACFGASVGVTGAEDACRAFSAFCRVSGILAPEMHLQGVHREKETGHRLRV
ncbi:MULTISPECIES: DUF982 domain-containing protein [unclassified Mesorhizobium]|uniref:DUF982 domain-containing protein n=1 Tax=unclassified Mesorhizobium TaxID=325217 RepID=UPI0006F99A2D|nr:MULTISPECIES: DUF982 domain-containing protein [unclassified Mesorhizobium]KQZ13779.1 hypothetical protein ASD27_06610 [Mesorhizobium sp. Root1471]KQZ36290.1 hypothetical protein ASD44_06605 [Mesorhizobium sp. Root554]MDR7032761.1 hypothetical protein [Mesorhizobium sp. BE184]